MVGCTKFAEDPAVSLTSTGAPSVSITAQGDSTVLVSVSPAANTGFYSYAVAAGAAGEASASTLLSKPSNYGKIASGVVDFSETPSVSLTIKGLAPNTTYTVYAVASSTSGVNTEVVSASATTGDSSDPAIVSYKDEATDSTMTFSIKFNDPVKVGTGKVFATFYAVNGDVDENGLFAEYKTFTVPADNISAEGSNLVVAIPQKEAVPGAYVAVTFEKGAAVNALGAACPGYGQKSIGADKNKAIQKKGIFSRYSNKNFDLTILKDPAVKDTLIYFQDWKSVKLLGYTQGAYPLYGLTEKAAAKVSTADSKGRTVSYPAVPSKTFVVVDPSAVAVYLSEAPSFGSYVSYLIEEGSVEDLFGNVNNALEAEKNYFCSYGYTLEDIIGTYTISCTNAISGDAMEGYKMVVEESDNEKEGNIRITKFLNVEGETYLTFNVHDGTLVIPEFVDFQVSEDEGSGICFFFNNAGDASVSFEPGKISIPGIVVLANWKGSSLTGFVVDENGVSLAVSKFSATRDE